MSVCHHDHVFEQTSLAVKRVREAMTFGHRQLCSTTSARGHPVHASIRLAQNLRLRTTKAKALLVFGLSSGGFRKRWLMHDDALNSRDVVLRRTSPSESFSTSRASDNLKADDELLDRLWRFLHAMYRFSRPHTVAGTVISICSISLLAVQGIEWSSTVLFSIGTALSAAILMNIFIVGLNQVFDIQIDKINKPHLPLASGEFTLSTAYRIIGLSLIASLGIGYMSGSPPLMATLLLSMFLGIAYSADIPSLRWKRNAFAAATCILIIRAVAVQLGFYYHALYSVGVKVHAVSKPLLCATGLLCYYSVVIALFKDIPDMNGDIQANIRTFTVRLGQKAVFWICIWLLTIMYVSAMAMGLSSSVLMTRVFFTCGNALSLCFLWERAFRMNVDQKNEITSFYMFVWKLFYFLYFFLPFLRFAV